MVYSWFCAGFERPPSTTGGGDRKENRLSIGCTSSILNFVFSDLALFFEFGVGWVGAAWGGMGRVRVSHVFPCFRKNIVLCGLMVRSILIIGLVARPPHGELRMVFAARLKRFPGHSQV